MWFDIFKTGTHIAADGTEHTYTRSDLDAIVANYNPAIHEAPLVIGHPKDNAPAYGWVSKLRRSGDVLQALAKDLLPEFVDMLRERRFPKRSISLYPGLSLRHVGFLGAMPPAVKGLSDIAFSSDENCTIIEYMEATMDETEALKARIAELEALVEELRTMIRKNEEAAAQVEAENFCESLIAQGKLLPAHRNKAIGLLKHAKVADFTEGLKEILSTLPAQVDFGEFAVQGVAGGVKMPARYKGVQLDAGRSAVYAKAREFMAADSSLSFEQAVNRVME
ncbi:MAG: hypothetical protein LBV04_00430 [Deferribacteraceae bacterium]|jgi:hypothetical protein|nr:hypothetical protein [Deferribacteraceae bacterium]